MANFDPDDFANRLGLFLSQGGIGHVVRDVSNSGGLREFTVNARERTSARVLVGPKGIEVKGPASRLRSVLRAWAGLTPPPRKASGQFGYELFSLGWKEWRENRDHLAAFIKKNGRPDETNITDDFRVNREILFHDYMFRQRMDAAISMKRLDWVIRSWLRRHCFVPLDIDALTADIEAYVRDSFAHYLERSGEDEMVPLGVAAEAVASTLCSHCTRRFVSIKGNYVCPQVRTSQDACASDVVDALYPYSNAGDVIAYTKTNLDAFVRDKTDKLKWYSLSPASPIEEAMAKGLEAARVLTVPQFQATGAEHRYKIDFVIPCDGPFIAIECDGLEFHATPMAYTRDQQRNRYLQERGFYVMRFSSREIFQSVERCVQEIDRVYWRVKRGKMSVSDPPRTNYFGVGGE